jgi:hypothetical protein
MKTTRSKKMNFKWLRSGFFSRYRIEIFMCAVIAEMLASPLADTHPRVGVVLGLVVLLLVLAGIGQMANRRIVRRIVLPIAGVWMTTRILEAFGTQRDACATLSPVVGLVFSCSILWAIFDNFQSEFGKPRNAIAEAFIGYLVIASAFSQLYWILNRLIDHAFNQTIPSTQSGTLLYFSMVTLTSVGYGGIIPVNPYVRIVAALESMSGIFFVAVVVARLVSSYRPRAERQDHSHSSQDHSHPSEDVISLDPRCQHCGAPAFDAVSSY